MSQVRDTDNLVSRIKVALAEREVRRLSNPRGMNGRVLRAAVLLPLFSKDGDYHLLFTKRTDKVKRHKGEISFPGGLFDPMDRDLAATALREAHEEIGLLPQDVLLLGELDEVVTLTDFVVSPFVGLIPYPYRFVPSPYEIAEIITIPLDAFFREGVAREGEEMTLSYHWGDHVIWGATARIVRQFLEIISKNGII